MPAVNISLHYIVGKARGFELFEQQFSTDNSVILPQVMFLYMAIMGDCRHLLLCHL